MNATMAIEERHAKNEACRYSWRDLSTGCYSLRGCVDCLKTEGCRIGDGGYCEADIPSDGRSASFERAIAQNLTLPAARTTNASALEAIQFWHFPASKVEYCPRNDSVCSECTRQSFWLNGRPLDSRFCLGTGGGEDVGVEACVCIANCEVDPVENFCPPKDKDVGSDGVQHLEVIILLIVLGILVAVLAVVACCVFAVRSHKRHQAKMMAELQTPTSNDTNSDAYVVVQVAPRETAKLKKTTS